MLSNFIKIVQENPNFVKAISSIADIMSKFERYNEEIHYLKKIIDIDNQNSEAFNQNWNSIEQS